MFKVRLPLTVPSGVEMREAERYEKTGLWCRADTLDRMVAAEVLNAYKTLPVKDRIVLDVGANIGAFARAAILAGADGVIAIEPERSNFECLRRNTVDLDPGRLELIRACAGVKEAETALWLHGGKNPGGTSQAFRRGRFKQESRTIDIRPLFEYVSSIKIDAEGAEYVVGWPELFPDSVTDVIAELHQFTPDQRSAYPRLREAYRSWKILRDQSHHGNTLIHWARAKGKD